MKILFWNIKNNSKCIDLLINDISFEEFDLFFFSEFDENFSNSIITASSRSLVKLASPINGKSRIKAFSRLPKKLFSLKEEYTDKFSHYILQIPDNGIKINLFSVHLISKLHSSENEQYNLATDLVRKIYSIEEDSNNRNSIVVGDFNMNPFERSMISANAFNAVNYTRIANMEKRTYMGQKKFFFYNPMWKYLKDSTKIRHSYYYTPNHEESVYFNLFDQVIIRPTTMFKQNFTIEKS